MWEGGEGYGGGGRGGCLKREGGKGVQASCHCQSEYGEEKRCCFRMSLSPCRRCHPV